jgi:hypothetical protein
MPPGTDQWTPVDNGCTVGQGATYPSLACDREGTLHLTYRYEPGGRNARVMYARRPKQGKWSQPRILVTNAVSEHSWTTNAVEVGPKGRLHVVFSNTLPVPDVGPNARYYGGSHLYSDDAGLTWRQFGDSEPLTLPAPAAQLKRIEDEGMDRNRIEADYGGPRGPNHSYYHKILLSNITVGDQGRPWVVLHNLLDATANLYRYEQKPGWVGTPLAEAVREVFPNSHIRHCGQVSRHQDGTVEVVLMVAPPNEHGWGAKGTELVRVLVDPAGSVRESELVRQPDPDTPNWLASSVPRPCSVGILHREAQGRGADFVHMNKVAR